MPATSPISRVLGLVWASIRGTRSRVVPANTVKCRAFKEANELLLFIVFLAWLYMVVQDWLFSTVDPYPYAASALTSLAVGLGFLAFLHVGHRDNWRDLVLLGATLLVVAHAFGFIPRSWGMTSAVAATVCGLATPALMTARKRENAALWRIGYATMAILGAVSLVAPAVFTSASVNPTTGVPIVLATMGVSGAVMMAARLLAVRQPGEKHEGAIRFGRWCAVAVLTGSVAALAVRAATPAITTIFTHRNALLGGGLGSSHRQLAIDRPLVMVLAHEQGGLSLFALSAVILAVIATGTAALIDGNRTPEQETTVGLCAGSLGALCGMLLAAGSGSPFFTVNSVAGTWAFTLALSSLGLAARMPRDGAASPVKVRTARVEVPESRRRRSTIWHRIALGGVATIFTTVFIVALWQHIVGNCIRRLGETPTPAGYKVHTPLTAITLAMQNATVAMEDKHFYSHHGLDVAALHRALRVNLRAGRIVQGGSTITQQLAKNSFLTHDRTLWRKIQEAALAWEMERQLPKQRILELYLNTINYGMGQRGVTNAARFYFRKTPSELTLAESAVLVGLVPRPPQHWLDEGTLEAGRRIALERIRSRWPDLYSDQQIVEAMNVPLDRLVPPYFSPRERGATETLPGKWQGVTLYSFVSPKEELPILRVSPVLKQEFGRFLQRARHNLHVVGVDHAGVYADRFVRGSVTEVSAHAYGQAIDLSGFRFADGTRLRVADHGEARVAARLAPIRKLLRESFDTVLDWENEPKRHQDHFHAEVNGLRPGKP